MAFLKDYIPRAISTIAQNIGDFFPKGAYLWQATRKENDGDEYFYVNKDGDFYVNAEGAFYVTKLSDLPESQTSNIYQVIYTVATEQQELEALAYTICEQYIPNLVDSLIDEWETELGLPDDCFTINVDDQTRRLYIYIKLTALNLGPESTYYTLAALLGLSIVVEPYTNAEPFIWYIYVENSQDDNVFPFTFPITFSGIDSVIELFKCLVIKQKPAHTIVIFGDLSAFVVNAAGEFYIDASGRFYTLPVRSAGRLPYTDDNGVIYVSDDNQQYTTD